MEDSTFALEVMVKLFLEKERKLFSIFVNIEGDFM